MCSPYFAIGIDSDTPNKHAEGLYEIINKVRPLACAQLIAPIHYAIRCPC
jgi:hypothetical protein